MPEATARAAGLGAAAGLRAMAAPAALSRAISAGRIGGLERTPFAALGSPGASAALQMLAFGELLADKLPIVPSRTSPAPLLGRAVSGALAGAALYASVGRRAAAGGALGAAAALTSAYAGERLRSLVGAKFGAPDFLVALVEDGIVLLACARLVR